MQQKIIYREYISNKNIHSWDFTEQRFNAVVSSKRAFFKDKNGDIIVYIQGVSDKW